MSKDLGGRRILICEDNSSGHRLVYVRHLLEFATRAGAEVTLATTPAAVASPEWALNLADVAADAPIHHLDGLTPRTMRTATHAVQPDLTIVPDADRLAMQFGVLGRWGGHGPVTMLLMRDPAVQATERLQRKLVVGAKSALLARARRISGIHLVGLRSGLARPRTGEAIALDPLERSASDDDVARLRADWSLGTDTYWFAVIGNVNTRKNLPLVAEAVAAVAADPTHLVDRPVGLLVAGTCEDGVLEQSASNLERLVELGGRTKIIDRLLGTVEFDAVAQAVDVLVAAHTNDGPSGVVARAGMHGIRVVAAGSPMLAEDVRQLPSAAWSELHAAGIADAMRTVMADRGEVPPLDLGTGQFCAALLAPLPT